MKECKVNHFVQIIKKNCSKIWIFREFFLPLHSENSPLQLKGYVDP